MGRKGEGLKGADAGTDGEVIRVSRDTQDEVERLRTR